MKIELCEGVEGPSLYIDDTRFAGPKPWGGGRISKKWELTDHELATLRAAVFPKEHPAVLIGELRTMHHRVEGILRDQDNTENVAWLKDRIDQTLRLVEAAVAGGAAS